MDQPYSARAFLRLSGLTPAKSSRLATKAALESIIAQRAAKSHSNVVVYEDSSCTGTEENGGTPTQDGQVEEDSCQAQVMRAAVQAVQESDPTKILVKLTEEKEMREKVSKAVMRMENEETIVTPMTPIVWDGQIKLDDDDASSSDGNGMSPSFYWMGQNPPSIHIQNLEVHKPRILVTLLEEEIDQVLATVAAIRSENLAVTADKIIPPTAVLSRPTLYYHQQRQLSVLSQLDSSSFGEQGSSPYTAAANYATLGYNPEEYQTNFTPPVRSALEGQKIMERCRFWPDCRNEDLCAYHHPTKLCQKFPNCWFGEKCLNIHPRCRFAPNCTKPNCRFAHYKLPVSIFPTSTQQQQQLAGAPGSSTTSTGTNLPSSNGDVVSCNSVTPLQTSTSGASIPLSSGVAPVRHQHPHHRQSQPILSNRTGPPVYTQLQQGPARQSLPSSGIMSGIACRYGGHCQNAVCVYKHPPPCRFGANCTNPNCPFLHRRSSTAGVGGTMGMAPLSFYHSPAAAAATGTGGGSRTFKWISPTLTSSFSSTSSL